MMLKYIKDAFKERINELGNDWLDDFSRQRSLEKLDAMSEMIAYPDNIMDDDYLNELYNSVSVTVTVM